MDLCRIRVGHWCSLLVLSWGICPVHADPPPQPVPMLGEQVPAFQLRDCYGALHGLDDFRDSRVVVVVFLGTECPLVKLYSRRLCALAESYDDQSVSFVGVNSNTQDTITELVAFANRFKLNFPLLKDATHAVADQFSATRTPEVVVLDHERRIRYRGRIDDQHAVGVSRPKPQRHDLRQAIDQLLADEPVTVPVTELAGCVIGRADHVSPSGEITYNQQIAEILNRRCVECHREGQIAPFPLTSYGDTVGWGETIREVVQQRRMPPWNANPDYGTFANDSRLSPEEQQMLFDWIDHGMPEGKGTPPPAPEFAEGWRIDTPDQVIFMNAKQEPFAVPAEGVVDYQYFRVDPGWTEDKYIAAAEARPGNTEVVHHIIAFVWPPGARQFQLDAMLVGYAPGALPTTYGDGEAMFVPAGSQLVFEVHYTPNGTPQQDLSCLGVKFIDKRDVRELVRGRLALNDSFRIPPGKPNHVVTASHTIASDSLLLTMSPHMHLRGKSFRFEARYPDQTEEILLDVPHYDFNWQLTYHLAEPKRLPKGTVVRCTATFDNSADNLANPDPDASVTWGQQSWEEMMIGFFNVKPAAPVDPTPAAEDPTGEWTWTQPGSKQVSRLQLRFVPPHGVQGVYEGVAGRQEVQNGRIDGRQLSLEVPLVLNGRQIVAVLQGQLEGDSLQGTISLAHGFGGRDLKWEAQRKGTEESTR